MLWHPLLPAEAPLDAGARLLPTQMAPSLPAWLTVHRAQAMARMEASAHLGLARVCPVGADGVLWEPVHRAALNVSGLRGLGFQSFQVSQPWATSAVQPTAVPPSRMRPHGGQCVFDTMQWSSSRLGADHPGPLESGSV